MQNLQLHSRLKYLFNKLPLNHKAKDQLKAFAKIILRPVRRAANVSAAPIKKRYKDRRELLFWSTAKFNTEHQLGIYNFGSCHLKMVGHLAPHFKQNYSGLAALYYESWNASKARTDLILQSTRSLPEDLIEEFSQKLRLEQGFFKSQLVGNHFLANTPYGKREYKKDIVFLSLASDIVRSMYRHKHSDMLVDPGGWWLNQSLDSVLTDLDTARWFRKNFESLGRITVEQSMQNYAEIIRLIQTTSEAKVVIFNTLVISPGDPTYNYQLVRNPETIRRREFNLALGDLAKQLDFHVFDLDASIKRARIAEDQVEFAHWPIHMVDPISQDLFRFLEDIEAFANLPRLK